MMKLSEPPPDAPPPPPRAAAGAGSRRPPPAAGGGGGIIVHRGSGVGPGQRGIDSCIQRSDTNGTGCQPTAKLGHSHRLLLSLLREERQAGCVVPPAGSPVQRP